MNAMAPQDYGIAHTSAAGAMFSGSAAMRTGAIGLVLIMNLSGPATASAHPYCPEPELTSATPFQRADWRASESTAAAVLEIRRLSGLTWEELADLFDVSRRSVHHWASGKPVNAEHDQALRGVLTALRHLDRGDPAATRALLLTSDRGGNSLLDLLKDGSYEEAVVSVASRAAVSRPLRPLSAEAMEARRLPHPTLLLQAEQDRPDLPAKARVARAARVPKS
jgi:transcriptional regulator with XRE-family HTH domain